MVTTMVDACATDDTAEPAEPAAKRIPGADFEPGPDCPLGADSRMRWSQREADERFAVALEQEREAADHKRREGSW